MKRHPALIPISREHHEMLLLSQLLKKGAPAYKGLPTDLGGKVEYAQKVWETLMKSHIEVEEKLLYPNLIEIAPSLADLVNGLSDDHHRIRKLFDALSADQDHLDELGRLIDQHIRKEERVLFQQVQALLTEEQMEQIRILLSEC